MNTIVILVCLVTVLNCMSKFQSSSTRQCQTICEFTRPAFSNLESLCTFRNSLIHISSKYSRKRCSPVSTISYWFKLQQVTYYYSTFTCWDIETNPGPKVVQNTFPCGLCEVDANWSNGGIACESCDVWYHRSALTLTCHLLIAWHPAHEFGSVLSATPAIFLTILSTTPYYI